MQKDSDFGTITSSITKVRHRNKWPRLLYTCNKNEKRPPPQVVEKSPRTNKWPIIYMHLRPQYYYATAVWHLPHCIYTFTLLHTLQKSISRKISWKWFHGKISWKRFHGKIIFTKNFVKMISQKNTVLRGSLFVTAKKELFYFFFGQKS